MKWNYSDTLILSNFDYISERAFNLHSPKVQVKGYKKVSSIDENVQKSLNHWKLGNEVARN